MKKLSEQRKIDSLRKHLGFTANRYTDKLLLDGVRAVDGFWTRRHDHMTPMKPLSVRGARESQDILDCHKEHVVACVVYPHKGGWIGDVIARAPSGRWIVHGTPDADPVPTRAAAEQNIISILSNMGRNWSADISAELQEELANMEGQLVVAYKDREYGFTVLDDAQMEDVAEALRGTLALMMPPEAFALIRGDADLQYVAAKALLDADADPAEHKSFFSLFGGYLANRGWTKINQAALDIYTDSFNRERMH